jgi:hypothetical protein
MGLKLQKSNNCKADNKDSSPRKGVRYHRGSRFTSSTNLPHVGLLTIGTAPAVPNFLDHNGYRAWSADKHPCLLQTRCTVRRVTNPQCAPRFWMGSWALEKQSRHHRAHSRFDNSSPTMCGRSYGTVPTLPAVRRSGSNVQREDPAAFKTSLPSVGLAQGPSAWRSLQGDNTPHNNPLAGREMSAVITRPGVEVGRKGECNGNN